MACLNAELLGITFEDIKFELTDDDNLSYEGVWGKLTTAK
jgi:hypothetical protein